MNRHSSTDLEGLTERPLKLPATPALDPADYADDMAAFDMTEEQKREFLEALWSIMRSLAELGIKYDVCGQLFGEFNQAAGSGPNNVNLDHSTNTEKQSD